MNQSPEMEDILIFGASFHTKYTIEFIELEKKFRIVGILDFTLPKGSFFEGYEILGKDEELSQIISNRKIKKGIVAIGDNSMRKKVVDFIIGVCKDFQFVSAIHPSVIIGKNTKIGVGNVMMAGVIINNDSEIGDHCFLATHSSVDHDSTLENYASISAGVTVGGNVIIRENSFIGLGANILSNKQIGKNCLIGAGSLVTKDFEDNILAYGVPAKEIRKRDLNEKFL